MRDDELRILVEGSDVAIVSRREGEVPLTQTLAGLGVEPEKLAAVNIKYEAPGNATNWLSLLVNLLPLVFIGALFFILFRQTQGSNNQALSFGKSKARVFTGDKPKMCIRDRIATHADLIVSNMLVPVSPSGTGKTFSRLTNS